MSGVPVPGLLAIMGSNLVWDSKMFAGNYMYGNASINSSGAHPPPPGNRGAFA